jgi:hypothetical protein
MKGLADNAFAPGAAAIGVLNLDDAIHPAMLEGMGIAAVRPKPMLPLVKSVSVQESGLTVRLYAAHGTTRFLKDVAMQVVPMFVPDQDFGFPFPDDPAPAPDAPPTPRPDRRAPID